MFPRAALSGVDNSHETLSQIRALLNCGGLRGATGVGGATPLGSLNMNPSVVHSHLAGASRTGTNNATSQHPMSPYLSLLVKQALNTSNSNNSNNNRVNTNFAPAIDLLLARQKLFSGQSNRQTEANLLSQLNFGNLATGAAEPALVSRTNSSSSTNASVSQAIRKRTSCGRFPGLVSSDEKSSSNLPNKRRRIAHRSGDWTPSCSASSKDATFRLPRPTGNDEKNPFQQHPLKSFRAKWDKLHKKASTLKFHTEAEKSAFMREMFARSLQDGCVKRSGPRKLK